MPTNDKTCVFCGQPPQDKSKEHVIPRWLLRLTGNEKRTAFFGVRFTGGPDVLAAQRHDFASYTVPACSACNNHYARLEEASKLAVEGIIAQKPITSLEVEALFDWLDKVRVGLWLAGRLRGTNLFRATTPNFHISDRIGSADRWARLTLLPKDVGEGLTYAGVGTPLFGSMPSAFSIRINNLLIQNASSPRIVSRWLGLPYPSINRVRTPDGPLYRTEMEFGKNRLLSGFMEYGKPMRGVEIVQPAYPFKLESCERLFRSPYVQDFFYDLPNLRAKPLIVDSREVRAFDKLGEIEYAKMQEEPRPEIPDLLSSSTLHLQNFVSQHGLLGKPVMSKAEYAHAVRLMRGLRKLNHLLLRKMAKQVEDPQMSNDGSRELAAGLKVISI